jgi:class 3 adenylate cyclase
VLLLRSEEDSRAVSIQEFQDLLDECAAASPQARPALDAALWDRFGRECAVLVSDMSGFSRITRDHGIVHFLGMIRRMEQLCAPAIAAHGGHLVKIVADNMFATFPSAQAAVDAALDLRTRLADDAAPRPAHERVQLGIGIDAGKMLDIGGEDMFGDPVNIASKLGEDLATGDDILVTTTAMAGVTLPPTVRADAHRETTSEVVVEYVALVDG